MKPSDIHQAYGIFDKDILFLQRILKTEGFYFGELDGLYGPLSNNAIVEFYNESTAIKNETREFSKRTENAILTLTLKTQLSARAFLTRLREAKIYTEMISGTRTYAHQNELYAIGRYGDSRKIVTHARGGFSNHNFATAFDIGIFSPMRKYIIADGPYVEAYSMSKGLPLEWGGTWSSFYDPSHYQLRSELKLADMRVNFEAGKQYIV